MIVSKRNRGQRIFSYFVGLVIAMTSAHAAGSEEILGVWNTEGKEAKIMIYRCGEKYCGKIVWSKDPYYPPDSKEGTPGTPVLDHNNPNPGLRKTPIIGLQILYDFTFAGDNLWTGGKLYNPDDGKTYSGKMTLVSPNQLNLRGFIGISLLGRTTTWTR
ncbi:MAG TPA: DUF2147 domain-containing protein [Nitrospirota bacterium]|nr:DUF2147 domain-containing protein [Nitrospirota bacterium]